MTNQANVLSKVRFELDSKEWHGHGSETLWAEALPSHRDTLVFKLKNSPFFTEGVSYLDIVRCTSTNEKNVFDFVEVLSHSGHSTFMLLVPPDSDNFESYWLRLEKEGCSFESGTIRISLGERKLYTVDVPPEADLGIVRSVLNAGYTAGVWLYQDGYVNTD